MDDPTFSFTPAFGGNNSVSAGNVSGNTGVVGPTVTPSSGVSGGFSWTNTLNNLGQIAVPIATGLINANATKAANKAAAKQAEREAQMQAEYLRAKIAAEAANNGNANASKMPAWLLPVGGLLLLGGLVLVLFRRPASSK